VTRRRNPEYVAFKLCTWWTCEILHGPDHLSRFLGWYASFICSVHSLFLIFSRVTYICDPNFIPWPILFACCVYCFVWLGWNSIKYNVGRSSFCIQCECTSDNAFLNSLWKVLVHFDRHITVFDVAILRKLTGGVYVERYKTSLYILIGFIEYQVRFYVPQVQCCVKWVPNVLFLLQCVKWYFDDITSFILYI
jgi:hypothetical protein